MRNSFGQRAERLRESIKMSLHDFARELGVSHARVSQLEHGKVKISQETVDKYVELLRPDEDIASELRAEANYSNNRLLFTQKSISDDELLALYTTYAPILSEELKAKLKELVLKEVESQGLQSGSNHKGKIPNPAFARQLSRAMNSKTPLRSAKGSKKAAPSISPARFAELAKISEEKRQAFVPSQEAVRACDFLQWACVNDPLLDVDIFEVMPDFLGQSYASIVGEPEGHTIVVERKFYEACANRISGLYFRNHVLLHEYAHHVLHGELLKTEETVTLEPHPLSIIENDTNRTPLFDQEFIGLGYSAPNSIELEAEYFAVLIAVPWIKLAEYAVSGIEIETAVNFVSRDYKTLPEITKRIMLFMRNRGSRESIKRELYNLGVREHKFFGM